MIYPLLPPGTLAKPQTSGGRFLWMQVLRDPGPPDRKERRIELEGPKGTVMVRRDRVHTDFDKDRLSAYDRVVVPPPGNQRALADAGRKPRANASTRAQQKVTS